ncbi:hypothetical protein PAECIP111891_04868 [Paenibacillus allorhizoplanae]|uniref:DUF3679 domain-containing protein n=1 Tax=Paenibacillus allorhizoplanae TaxID=2905648 RepID=A0ABM9CPS4_9BACL|nr:DUF3679 domain-containing protein [Paenibacillus allorhizoplanae]CAH1219404.1 hypothetical protein PAECIP111891_04868 [Paenibacillus allorhizoplanae]
MRLRHFYIKVGLFGLLLLFCILFGVSLASNGMERIEGPQPSSKAAQQVAPTKAPGKVVTTVAQVSPTPTPPSKDTVVKGKQTTETQAEPVAIHDNSLNRVGNKLGELLQITAHHGIKLFISLFDAVLGKG